MTLLRTAMATRLIFVLSFLVDGSNSDAIDLEHGAPMDAWRATCADTKISLIAGHNANSSWLRTNLATNRIPYAAAFLALASEFCAAIVTLTASVTLACRTDFDVVPFELPFGKMWGQLKCSRPRECLRTMVRAALVTMHGSLAHRLAGIKRYFVRRNAPEIFYSLVHNFQSVYSGFLYGSDDTEICSQLARRVGALENEVAADDGKQQEQCLPVRAPLLICMNFLTDEFAFIMSRFHMVHLAEVVPPVPSYTLNFDWNGHRDILYNLIEAHAAAGDSSTQLLGVEIGVWSAGTSVDLLERFPSLRLLLVDPYHTLGEAHVDSSIFDAAIANLRPYRNRATMVLQKSEEAVSWFSASSFDFVFVDGDHSYRGVKADMEAWWPSVKTGGIFCGHDYDAGHLGVVQAVNEFAQTHQLKLSLGHAMWWVIKT